MDQQICINPPKQNTRSREDLANHLARRYHQLTGKYNAEKYAPMIPLWKQRFMPLLSHHSAYLLEQVMKWAFNESTFWSGVMIRINGDDPVDYFLEKLPTIMQAYLAARNEERVLNKKSAKATPPRPSVLTYMSREKQLEGFKPVPDKTDDKDEGDK